MQEKDSTATHFRAVERKSKDGWAITLYRFKKRNGDLCEKNDPDSRPQYLGPMGWSFHSSTKDEDVIPKLHLIDILEAMTGDNLEKEIWQESNIYAG